MKTSANLKASSLFSIAALPFLAFPELGAFFLELPGQESGRLGSDALGFLEEDSVEARAAVHGRTVPVPLHREHSTATIEATVPFPPQFGHSFGWPSQGTFMLSPPLL